MLSFVDSNNCADLNNVQELNETYPTVDDSASRERVLRFLTAIDGLEVVIMLLTITLRSHD